MENQFQKITPWLLAILMTVVFFWQFFVKGLIPMPASFMMAWYEPWKSEYSKNGVPAIPHKAVGFDVFRQLFPFKNFMMEEVKKGTIPFWNPYNGAGQPMIATLQPGFFNPFSYLLLFDNKIGWAWYIMLQLPLLFLATYWYARTLNLSAFGASMAGAAISFSGVSAARLSYGEYVYPLLCLPLLLGMIEAIRSGRLRIAAVVLPLVVTFLLVSVQPQVSAYILLTIGVYALVRLGDRKTKMYGAILVVVGGGLAAIQLVSTLELYQQANVTSVSSLFIFDKFLMPLSHLITIIIPNYFGNSGTYNYWGGSDYTETVVSMGILPVMFAAIAIIFSKRQKDLTSIIWFFVWGIGVTILLTLDWIGPRLLYRLPIPIVSTSIPTRLYMLTSFFIAMLAGIGASRWEEKQEIKSFCGILALGFCILIVTFWMRSRIVCPSVLPGCVTVSIRNTLLELLVGGAGAVMMLIGSKKLKVGIILLCISVGVYNAWKILPFSPASYVVAPHPLLTRLASIAPNRIAGFGDAALTTNFSTQYHMFDSNYYNPLYIKRYGELVSYVNTGDRLKGLTRSDVNVVSDATVSAELAFRRERFWDLTGTSVLVTKKDEHWQVSKRPTALPRAYLVADVKLEPNPEKELAAMFDSQTDMNMTAFVEEPISDLKFTTGVATISSYQSNRVEIDTQTKERSFLVLSDTYYPGWKAAVDGKETPVYRTNYAFRGVVVPKGSHTILFYYDPDSFKIGLGMSILSLAAWIGLAFLL